MQQKFNIKPRSNDIDECPNNICEEADDYPERYIKDLVHNSPHLHDYFDEGIIIRTKINDDDDGALCSTIVKTVYPKKAVNADKITKFIINDDENRQGIITEQCQLV